MNAWGEADYDGWSSGGIDPAMKGDMSCRVGITDISAPSIIDSIGVCGTESAPGTFSVECVSSVGDIRSVRAYIDLDGSGGYSDPREECDFQSWTGATTSRHDCAVPSTDGTYSVVCEIVTDMSYVVGSQSMSEDVVVDCRRRVFGDVLDAKVGVLLDGAEVVIEGYVPMIAFGGRYDSGADAVWVGSYDMVAVAALYDSDQKFSVPVLAEPTQVDFLLQPEECTAECTLGGVCMYGVCDGVNGCDVSGLGLSPEDQARLMSVCEGQPEGSQRDFDDDRVVTCCEGPVESESVFRTPLSLESCSEQVIPRQRLVEYNGKPYYLTVAIYKDCE